MKKILLRLCVIMSLFTICMFGSSTANATSTVQQQQPPEFNKQNVEKYAKQCFEQWKQLDLSFMKDSKKAEMRKESMTADGYKHYESWFEVIDQAGEFEKILSCNVEMETDENGKEDVATATVIAKYTKKDIRFIVRFDNSFYYTNPEVTIDGGNKASVGKALLNTLMGMGTVFIVLIFISFIISLFKFIPSLFDRSKNKAAATEAVVVTEEPVIEEEEEELADDGELVAVITAAIMASLGDAAPTDGLVVRSIRKVNKSKWRNA